MSQLFNMDGVIYCAIVSFAALGTFKKGSNLFHVLQYFKELDIYVWALSVNLKYVYL